MSPGSSAGADSVTAFAAIAVAAIAAMFFWSGWAHPSQWL